MLERPPTSPADPDARPVTEAPVACADIDDTVETAVATANAAGEYGFSLTARSASATKWSEASNEALVLEVTGSMRGFIGQLVLHQGQTEFCTRCMSVRSRPALP